MSRLKREHLIMLVALPEAGDERVFMRPMDCTDERLIQEGVKLDLKHRTWTCKGETMLIGATMEDHTLGLSDLRRRTWYRGVIGVYDRRSTRALQSMVNNCILFYNAAKRPNRD